MKQEEIKAVVRETIAELQKQGFLKDAKYADISDLLREHYKNPREDVKNALECFESDKYFEIIPLHYRDHFTLEMLAEIFQVDVTTISRNKKRLCFRIYEKLQPS